MTLSRVSRYSRLAMNELQRSGAFVVQFRTGSNLEAGRASGRIEHISSGWTACFDSIDELVALLGRALKEHSVDAAARDHNDTRTRSES